MMRNTRVVGIVVGVVAIALFIAQLGWLYGARDDGSISSGGFALGWLVAVLVVAPLAAISALLLARGRLDAATAARQAKTRTLLNLVLTKGKVSIGEAITTLEAPRDEVRAILLDAVGRGLFSGYVNWQEGMLYAREAAAGVQPCPNCGGTIEIAGRGVLQCPYCGTEIFQSIGEGVATVRGVTPPDAASALPPTDAAVADAVDFAPSDDPAAGAAR